MQAGELKTTGWAKGERIKKKKNQSAARSRSSCRSFGIAGHRCRRCYWMECVVDDVLFNSGGAV